MGIDRTIFLLELLKKKTNNKNKLTISQLIDLLEVQGHNVTRNTVKSDINSLIDSGYNIIETKARYNTSCYHYESEFSIEECRVILDSLYSNKFIKSESKTQKYKLTFSVAEIPESSVDTCEKLKREHPEFIV